MFAVGCRGGGAAQKSSAWRCHARRALQMQRESAVTELRRGGNVHERLLARWLCVVEAGVLDVEHVRAGEGPAWPQLGRLGHCG